MSLLLPASMPVRLRSLCCGVVMAGATLVTCTATFASDHAAAAADAKPAAASGSAAKAPREGAAKPAGEAGAKAAATSDAEVVPTSLPKPRVIRDPIDVIRERLADKLGNPKAAEAAGANELHVVSNVAMTSTGHAAVDTAVAPTARGAAVASVGGAGRPRRAARAPRGDRAAHEPAVVAPVSEAPREARWDYQGLGNPETWAQLKPEFSKCASGTRQSPIDIRDGIKVQLDPVLFAYRESAFTVVDDGHTVQVNVGPGSSIEVMGHRYELVEFHFHRPSEERINGRQFDMSVHLVHKDVDGRLAVVAVMLDRGSVQPVVQKVWNNLPLEKGDTVAARATIDIEALLPQDRRYFTYMGSMTTPPCSEGVLWMVMKQPVEASPEQIGIFARLYPMNARPIQQASGRLIKEN